MTATASTNTYTADGTTKNFEVGFPFISENDVRVFKNDLKMTRGTHYTVQDPSAGEGKNAVIAFVEAPSNAASVKFYRNTPINVPDKNPVISQLSARVALYRMQEAAEQPMRLNYNFTETDLLAGTAQTIIAPCDGYIEADTTEVTKTVTTGGDITVAVDGNAVTGLTNSIANSAAVGNIVTDTPTTAHDASTQVRRGEQITITPSAEFATAGAAKGYLTFQPADLD